MSTTTTAPAKTVANAAGKDHTAALLRLKTASRMDILLALANDEITADEADVLLGAASAKAKLTYKVSEKGALSVYGLNARFPLTAYVEQWERLDDPDEVARRKQFIADHYAELTRKAKC